MIDWTAFHAATVAGTRPVLLADACARAWRWLELAPDSLATIVAAAHASDADARTTVEALSLVWRRLWRDAGVNTNDMQAFQQAFDDLAAGRAGDLVVAAAGRAEAAVAIKQIVLAQFPALGQPPLSDEDLARLNAATPALSTAIEGVGTGLATDASLRELEAAIAAFEPLGLGMAPATRREHAWWMGMAWWAMGAGSAEAARHTDAGAAFERAATWYDAAGDEKSAGSCRQRAESLAVRLRADVDAASAVDARALLSQQEVLERVGTLTSFASEVGRAGDRFEAASLGEQAAALLVAAGYADPETGFDAALQEWIATASTAAPTPRTGTALFEHLCAIVGHWAIILGARSSDRLTRDADGSMRAERTLRGLAGLTGELARQADIATQHALDRFTVWEPDALQLAGARSVDRMVSTTADRNELDDALYALRVACNEGPSAALLDQADRLLGQAEALASRVHAARALIERAYILLALGRHEDVPAAAAMARERLLAGNPPQLDSFSTNYERELYLTVVTLEARASAAKRDHGAVLAACLPALLEIETERHRISSPYQQSAALATRTDLYELVAAAAYRAGDWDLLLDTTERLKARAALASLGPVDRQTESTDLDREWLTVMTALRAATPGSPDVVALRDRRRWLSTLRAIERARHANLPEALTVDAVARGLAVDEAAISWFWVSADALIVQAFTCDRHDVHIVILDEVQQAQLRECLECVTAFSGPLPADSPLISRAGDLVEALGPVLLPSSTRDLVAGRRRLALSPHRSLHLFPFHAMPWGTDDPGSRLIEHAAVRYVPNLTSLLVPWQGTREGPVLAVGMGWFDRASLPPLPGAEAEAREVAAIHGPRGEFLRNPDRATFVARLAAQPFRCVHLATHGSSVLTGAALDDPLESCVCLRDGDLTAWDLSALNLRAEVVVLAACDSGQRAVSGRGLASLPGDDLFGLQSVLFEAGAWSVLGALWPVGDDTARTIMVGFHQAYADGQPVDLALQTSLRTYLRRPGARQRVYDWAPFVLSALGGQRAPGAAAN